MLHISTVESGTLDLLKKLMAEPEFTPFRLVGGTALALQIGHRVSIDLDFFGQPDELNIPLINNLLAEYGSLELLTASKNILSVRLNDVKVDFVRYNYPWLEAAIETEGLRLASLADIAAMKLAAITGRGRRRDFTDLYFLLNTFTLREMLNFYERKFPDGNTFLVLKSLAYFEDAEDDQILNMLQPVKWETIKQKIVAETTKLS